MVTRFLASFSGPAKRAAIFEVIHIPVDIGVVGLLTGDWTIAIGAVLIQHTVVFILHTIYDRYSYKDYYEGKDGKDKI